MIISWTSTSIHQTNLFLKIVLNFPISSVVKSIQLFLYVCLKNYIRYWQTRYLQEFDTLTKMIFFCKNCWLRGCACIRGAPGDNSIKLYAFSKSRFLSLVTCNMTLCVWILFEFAIGFQFAWPLWVSFMLLWLWRARIFHFLLGTITMALCALCAVKLSFDSSVQFPCHIPGICCMAHWREIIIRRVEYYAATNVEDPRRLFTSRILKIINFKVAIEYVISVVKNLAISAL
jgi:hypothetical protein